MSTAITGHALNVGQRCEAAVRPPAVSAPSCPPLGIGATGPRVVSASPHARAKLQTGRSSHSLSRLGNDRQLRTPDGGL